MINKSELAAATFDGLVIDDDIHAGARLVGFFLRYADKSIKEGYIAANIDLKPVSSTVTVPALDIQDSMDYEIKSYAVADNALAICFDCDEVHCVAGLAFALTESQKTRLDLLLDEHFQDKFADADLDGKLTMMIPTGVTNDY